MHIVNLTPHSVVIVTECGIEKQYPSAGLARVGATFVVDSTVDGIKLGHTEYGMITGLPEPEDGTIYVVSALVRAACPQRCDVYSPAEYNRNSEGQVVSVRALTR